MSVLEQPLFPAGTTDRVLERLFPQVSPYMHDSVGWVEDRLGEQLWSKQREIAESVEQHRHTAVPSCHSSGKSYLAGRLADWWIDAHPVGEAFVITTAPTANQVSAILWREIARGHRKGGLRGKITRGAVPAWTIDGELVAFGRKPADYVDAEQAMQAFQGVHARYVLVILDEATGIPQWLFDAAETLATGPNDRILAIGNPDDPTSPFRDICEEPDTIWNVIRIDAFSTPRFTGEPVDEQIPLITEQWVDERRVVWGEESPLFQSKIHARFPDISDDTLFPPALIRKAWETELAGMVQGGYGGDVARYGDDETVVYRNRGGVLRLVETARKQSLTTTAGMFARIVRAHGADEVPINVDGDGLGAGVVDQLRDQELPVLEFRGGMPANDPERFVNRRAEMFWLLREAIDIGEVDLDPADLDLAAQLGKLKWSTDVRGRVRVESKEDMRRRGVKSPDRADAAAMAFVCPSHGGFLAARQALDRSNAGSETGDLMEVQW
jgi:hypothetical protein